MFLPALFLLLFIFVVLSGADAQERTKQSTDNGRGLGYLLHIGPAPNRSQTDVSSCESREADHDNPLQYVIHFVREFQSCTSSYYFFSIRATFSSPNMARHSWNVEATTLYRSPFSKKTMYLSFCSIAISSTSMRFVVQICFDF